MGCFLAAQIQAGIETVRKDILQVADMQAAGAVAGSRDVVAAGVASTRDILQGRSYLPAPVLVYSVAGVAQR